MGEKKTFAGIGGKRPQLNVNVNLILLDEENPRLAPYLSPDDDRSQESLIKVLYQHFDNETIATSLVQNGYFDEEPLVLVPKKLPTGFKHSDFPTVPELTAEYRRLIDAKEIEFVVKEGNRRVSAIKLILSKELRQSYSLEKTFPTTDDSNVLEDISNVPCIIYPDDSEIYKYLGVRHIAGILKWEAFAQASYSHSMVQQYINKGSSAKEAITKVNLIIGITSGKLKKQYTSYKLFSKAKELDYDVSRIKNNFSLLTVAYNTKHVREYFGATSFAQIDFSKPIVSEDNEQRFLQVLTWIYGDKKSGASRVLTDSRKITEELNYVLNHAEATKHLIKFSDLEGAYDRTDGEKEFLIKKLNGALRAITTSLSFSYKYAGDKEISNQISELESSLGALKNSIDS